MPDPYGLKKAAPSEQKGGKRYQKGYTEATKKEGKTYEGTRYVKDEPKEIIEVENFWDIPENAPTDKIYKVKPKNIYTREPLLKRG